MPYRYLICTSTKTFSNDVLRKLAPLTCCHGSQQTRFSKGRTHNRHFYTSHKLSSKLPHRPHSHWFNENKQFIQNCNYFKTNYVICCAPPRRFPGNDVTWIRDYHISTVLFNDEGKKEVKNVESTKISESKADKPQKDGVAKVVKPAEKSKEVGPPAKKKLSVRIMDELKHYYHGFKLLFKEFRMSTRYMIDVVIFRKSLKRREIKQVIRSTFDILRILPMIIILVIPFMEFAIPVIIKFFPGLLPSTFQPKKTDDMRLKVLKAKIEMTKNMVETIKSSPLISKKTSTAEDFANFVANVRTKGIQPTTEEIMKYSKFFEDELTLENLSRPQLQAMCRVLDLQPMGMDGFLRFSLRMKLKRLKMDDVMIKQEGVDSLTIPELQAANRERGMRALGVSEERLRSQLQQWLDLHLDKNVPASLLLFSRALYLPETLSTEEQLKESIINLPETMTSKEKIAEALALKEKEKEKLEEEKISKVPEVVPVTPPPVEEPVVSEEQPATGVKGLTAKLQSKLADFKAKVDEYDKEATKKRVLKIWKMIRELGEENQREHKKFFEEYKEFLKEGEKVPVMKSEAAPAKGAKVATPVSEEEKKAMATAEAVAAETIMTSEGETQTDPALMLESQPGEELKDLDEQITTEDLEDIEDALYEAAKERAVDLEKEEREEDLEDCEEDVDELKAVVLQEGDVKSKNASKLWKMVNKAVDQLDKQIDDFHDIKDEIQVEIDTREVRLKKSPELQTNLEKREEILSELKKRKSSDAEQRKSVISINEMLLAMKRIKKIPDDVRFQKIVQVLDEDRDGRIELVHAMKVRINCSQLRCPAKYQVIPNHSACLEKSPMASNSGVIDADKTTIVDSHNSYRAGVVPTAVLMYKMYWDDEIAMIAQNYADACKGLVHDSGRQRSIPGRFSVGQNLAAGDYDVSWGNIVKLWYDEVKDFTMNGTNNFGRVGHYTQVVSANSILIGCGFALCGTTRNYVCNYGPAGNMDYNNPYRAGTACSGCTGSCSGDLCDCTGKVCLNGGTMDPSTCSCSCKTPATTYVGDTCQLNCSTHTDNPGCTTHYSPSHCDRYINVPEDCPALCNVCPCAGIDNIIGDACILGSLDNGGNRLEPFQQYLFQISALLYLLTVGFLQM